VFTRVLLPRGVSETGDVVLVVMVVVVVVVVAEDDVVDDDSESDDTANALPDAASELPAFKALLPSALVGAVLTPVTGVSGVAAST
jgi:hypothetical protein